MKKKAEELGVSFALKDSPTLLNDVRKFTIENFGFGDFVFRTKEGIEVGRAYDLRSLKNKLPLFRKKVLDIMLSEIIFLTG